MTVFQAPDDGSSGVDPLRNGAASGPVSAAAQGDHPGSARQLVLTTIATVQAESVRWLWRDRLVLGMLNVVVGEPGLGKSTLSYDLGAKLSRGELDGDLHTQPVDVLVVTYEDHLASVVRPRLEAAGADLTRVHEIGIQEADGSEGLLTLPGDIELIRQAIERTGARLLVVDPIVASLSGEINSHKDQDVRRVLAPLAQLAEEHDVAALVVMHVNKSQAREFLRRVGASVGFTGAARSMLLVARDPDDPDGERGLRRILAHGKCNVGKLAPSLLFEIESVQLSEEIETSRLVFLGECEITTAELLGGENSDENSRADIDEAILAKLVDGPSPSREVKSQLAAELDCSKKTVERAAVKLATDGELVIESGGWPRHTTWALPPSGDATVGTSLTRPRVPTVRPPVPSRDSASAGHSRDGRDGGVPTVEPDQLELLTAAFKEEFGAEVLAEHQWAELERTQDIETWDFPDSWQPLVAIDGEEFE